jgi:hypothetical protein
VPADDVVRGRCRPAINDDGQIEAVVLIERNGGEMAGRAELRRREGPLVGVCLARGDELRQRLLLPVVRNDVHQRRTACERDRSEIGDGIVGHIAHDQPRDIVRRGVEQHRIAIRRGPLDVEAPDRAVPTGTVLDHELNTALGRDLGCNEAREGVDASARRYRNDDADWMIGETRLRAHDSWREHGARGRQDR